MPTPSPSSKRCFACGEEKPVDEFHRHPAMADGHLGKCKSCARFDVAARRANTIDRVRLYDRRRGATRKRIEKATAVTKAWRAAHPERGAAHSAVRRALRAGLLVRPDNCAACRRVGKVEAHHFDYAKPLDVVWFCKPCHIDADRVRSDRWPAN